MPCHVALRRLPILSVAAIFVSVSAVAQQPAQVLVTGSRMEQAVTDVLANTTILTSEDLRNSQIVDLPALLRSAAGIEVAQNGGAGSVSSVFMRGSNSNHTLILLDGMRINSSTAGTTALERLTLDQIERVEIVRGNVSALYGSEAIGGVIQLFTRQGRGAPALSGSLSTGANGTLAGNVDYGGTIGSTRFHLGLAGLHSSGFGAIDPNTSAATRAAVNPDKDGFRNTTVNASVAHTVRVGHEVGVRAFVTRGLINFDNAFGAVTDVDQTANFTSSFSAYTNNRLTDAWRSSLTYSKSVDSSDQTRNFRWNGHIRTDQRQFAWQNEFKLAPTHKLLLGLESLSQRAESESTTSRFYPARQIGSLLAGYTGSIERTELQLNLRSDRYSDFGRAQSYFAAVGYNLTPAWKIVAQQSTAFRAPTFNDLYFPNFGTLTLQPERARSRELALQWASGSHLLRLGYFHTDYSDLIVGAGTPSRATNINKARVKGVETNYTGRVMGFDVRANLTWQDPIATPPSAALGPQLQRRARAYGNLGIGRSFGAWRFGADLYASGKRVDTEITAFPSQKVTLGSYSLLSLTARYNISKETFIAARLENATDAGYQLVHGYNTPRRGLFVTLGYQPK